jgi:hypothetical protein
VSKKQIGSDLLNLKLFFRLWGIKTFMSFRLKVSLPLTGWTKRNWRNDPTVSWQFKTSAVEIKKRTILLEEK